MNMKLSAVANNIYEKATEYKKDIKNTLDNTVKPFVDKQYKHAEKITKDSFEYVKNNPKKVGRYAAMAVIATAAAAAAVKTIKELVNAKKQNQILAKFAIMQKQSNDELKDYINSQKEIIAGKDAVIDAQKKVIEDQKAKLAEK